MIDKRGGMGALKEDAEEVRRIAQRKGSLADKAKAAGEAIKEPGAPGPEKPRPRAGRGRRGRRPPGADRPSTGSG